MPGLFEQFIIETRELLDLADAQLLQLERNPDDREAVTELFRALHTLKGATGLFDLPAFTRLTHVGEDALMLVRAGQTMLGPELADRLFAMVDLSRRWVDALEHEGSLPPGADGVALEQEALMRPLLGQNSPAAGPAGGSSHPDAGAAADALAGPGAMPDWLANPTDQEKAALDKTAGSGACLTLVEYTPRSDCFYVGDDPLDLFRRIPDLLSLRVEPTGDWPDVRDIDPYHCWLRFCALSAAPVDQVASHFRAVPDQSKIWSIAPPQPARSAAPRLLPVIDVGGMTLTEIRNGILQTQLEILGLPGNDDEILARHASVRQAVAGIIRSGVSHLPPDAGLPPAGDVSGLSALITRMLTLADAEPVLRQDDVAGHSHDGGSSATINPAANPAASSGGTRKSLRVDADRIDQLMELVGELVGAKAGLPFLAREATSTGQPSLAQGLKDAQGQIDGIAAALQDAVLRLRTLPLDRVFSPLPRLVRDIARKLEKEVDFQVLGGETEADKDILDALGDPLLHMMRNAMDHGIETPDQRRAAGKDPVARLTLSASQDRDGIVIEITEDGRGIDPDRLRRRVIEQGLMTEERAAQLSRGEALRLVFLPGLSTADRVTDLSGRGVGMDAVKNAVERAGGRVVIRSVLGQGTSFRLHLPLTMMVTRVLVLELAGALYGVPVAQVIAMHRVRDADIRRVKNQESIVIGDELLPLIRLRDRLDLPPRKRNCSDMLEGEAVLVVDLAGQPAGLVVDDFRERADVVLKPMSGVLSRLRGFSGTASMGDGGLMLVLNLRELI